MSKLLRLLPLKSLIKLILDLLAYVVQKTKNKKDDQILQYLKDVYNLIQPLIPESAKK